MPLREVHVEGVDFLGAEVADDERRQISENRSHKSADGRVATEAAWLNGNRFTERRKRK